VYRFQAALWKWNGGGASAWYFVTAPFDVSDDIEERTAHVRRGFGAVKVRVRIGATTWETSLFPSAQAEAYVLPVKAAVRRSESIADGDDITVELTVIEPGTG
jgi:hypothetical protein